MNPYDAILEQLRKAQERGVETVTNRLDFVLESLEGLIAEAKAAVAEAIPSEPDELFPISECSNAVEAARRRVVELEQQVSELQDRVRTLEDEAAGAGAASGAVFDLGLLRRLDAARSQSELLRELLPLLLDHAGRAAVLVVRDGTVSAWSGIGFPDGERLRSWQGEVSASPALSELMTANAGVLFSPGDDALFSGWLAGEAPAVEAALVPVTLRGRTVGALYVDRVEDGPWDLDAVRSLTAVVCWLIDTLTHRTTVPSPVFADLSDLRGGETPEAAEGAGEPAAGEPEEPTPEAGSAPVEPIRAAVETPGEEREETEVEAEVAPPAPAGEAPQSAEVEAPGEAPAGVTAPPPAEERAGEAPPEAEGAGTGVPAGFDPAATMRVDTAGLVPPPAAPEPAGEEPPAAAGAGAAAEGEAAAPPPVEPVTPPPPVAPVAPPPPVEPVSPPPSEEREAAPEPGDEAEHEEARRFARLLVSEIKLYNPEEVERGRANKDLYQRLKEDIDRSREMFDRRIPESVRSVRDYFREELVRILADGDEDALGM